MSKFKTFINEFIADEQGLTAVEYAVAGALIVTGLVAGFTLLGDEVAATIEDICDAAASDGSCGP